jgi:PsbP-like protein
MSTVLTILWIAAHTGFVQAQDESSVFSSGTNTSLTTYTDPTGTYSLQYPSQWEVTYYEPATRFDTPSTGFKISAVSSVSVDVTESEGGIDEDMLDLGASYLASTYESEHPGVNVEHVDADTYEIDGNKALAMLSSGTLGAFMPQFSSSNAADVIQVKNLVILAYLDDYGLKVQYFAPEVSFDKNIAEVDSVIDSIRLLNQNQEGGSEPTQEETNGEDN